MRADDVALFVTAIDHGGFAAAARHLNIPRSSVSKRIGALEAAIGVRLVARTTRQFALTEAGQHFYRHAAAAMIELETAKEAVEALRSEPSGLVVVSASLATMAMGLGDLLNGIATRFPRLCFKVRLGNRFSDPVAEGVDIILRAHFGPLADSGLVSRRIGFTQSLVVAAPQFVHQHGPILEPDDLDDVPAITGDASADQVAWTLLRGAEERSVRLQPRMMLDDPLQALAAVAAGLGVARLPRRLCHEHLSDGRLVTVLDDWDAGGATLSLLTPTRRGLLPSVRLVSDEIVAGMKSSMA